MIPLRILIPVASMVAAFLLEGLAIRSSLGAPVHIVIILHASAAIFAGHGLAFAPRTTVVARREQLFWFGGLLALLIPPFGILGVTLLALRRDWDTQDRPTLVESWESRRRRAARKALEKKRRSQQVDGDMNAIVDALEDRDPGVRVAAIEALFGETTPEAARLLRRAKRNDVFEVRVRAVEALERIHDEYTSRIRAAEGAVRETPGSVSALACARLLMEWSEFGLEEASQRKRHLDRARQLVEHAMIAYEDEHSSTVLLLRATILRRLGRAYEAEATCREVIQVDERNRDAWLGVAESQFQLRQFDALMETCRAIKERIEDPPEELSFWLRSASRVIS